MRRDPFLRTGLPARRACYGAPRGPASARSSRHTGPLAILLFGALALILALLYSTTGGGAEHEPRRLPLSLVRARPGGGPAY